MSNTTSNQHAQPFWNDNAAQISGQLWLPTASLQASEWNSKPIAHGWGTCLRWSSGAEVHSNVQGLFVAEPEAKTPQTTDEPALRVKRFRVYPTAQEKDILRKWFGAARWTYNECLRAIKDEKFRKSKKDLRARAINKEAIDALKKPWLGETPYDIRNEAMDDLLKAFASGEARYANDKKAFNIKYRSRQRCSQESIVIHRQHWRRRAGKYAFLRHMKCHEKLPEELPHDSRLVVERGTGHFYLCVPGAVEVVERPAAVPRVVSLDPGVRTFLTGYTPDGEVIELGKGDIGHIYRLCHRLDVLQSQLSMKGLDHWTRWPMRRAAARIRRRIRNLVDDMHKRAAKYLCSSYGLVILPTFLTQQMVDTGRRRIGSKTARAMLTWSHYRFQKRLVDKAGEYPCRVVLVSEAHTCKTCGACGHLNNVGSSKTFRCSHCGLVCDRDINGARNILLRYCHSKLARGESVMD
ncbi:putative transposase DNA-binding domain-containing protein [Lipomyces orientalis]|uniref:Transposase DNA-binding domain-containing protein n=1 Tax=Lipomyces orientalis TaxID=1233043 RepID=A0ACC3TE50_9ASCO